MRPSSFRSLFLVLALFALTVSFITGCGGSSTPTVHLSSTVTGIDQGQTVTITATTANDSGDGVTWALTGVGSLSSNTTTSVLYTAPASVTTATTVTITATSIKSATVTTTISITVEPPPAITTAAGALTAGQVGTANYSTTIATSGGVAPLTFTVASGALPNGLSLNASTGAITGTPSVSGGYNFSIKVTDSGSPALNATVAFSINIAAAPAITFSSSIPSSLPNATVGTAYSEQLSATGGAGTITYAINSGSLPPGLTLSSSGLISGNLTTPLYTGPGLHPYTRPLINPPVVPDVFSFTVKATDAYNDSAISGTYTINAVYPTMNITSSASLPNAVNGSAYGPFAVVATGGNGTYSTYSVNPANALTQYGLGISGTGAISGTTANVTATTVNNFTIQVQDSYGDYATQSASFTLYPTLAFTTPTTLPSGSVSAAYTGSIVATGGSGSGYTYAVTSGTGLSAVGLSLSSSGAITGTPATGQTETNAPFTVQVTDGAGNKASQTFNLTIYAGLGFSTSATLPAGEVGTIYSQSIVAVGGSGNYTYSITSGTGLSAVNLAMSGAGAITGTPNATETAGTITVKVLDNSTSLSTSSTFSLTVYPALSFSNGTLASGDVNSAYSSSVAATGGSGSYSYTVLSGTGLSAPGLSLATGGTITGTPSASENSGSVTIKVTDSANFSTTASFGITIYPAISFSGGALASGDVGQPYSGSVTGSGGSGSLTYSVASGTGLSAIGLTLNSNGTITGTPSASETGGTVSIKATDSTTGASVSSNFTITVYAAITFTGTAVPSGNQGIAYTGSVAATGGSGNYTYALQSGGGGITAVGLTLNSNGSITGTPNGTETSASFSVKVTDTSTNASVTSNFTITIYSGLTFSGATLASGNQSVSYSAAVSATGGSGNYSYTVVSGTGLSAVGLSLSTGGSITGTPNATESGAGVTIKVTDTSTNNSVSANFTLTIYSAISFPGAALTSGDVGQNYSSAVSATGGSGSFTYTVTSGTALSAETLTLASGGGITGTPTTTETAAAVSIKATDSNTGNSVTSPFTLTIYGAITFTGTALPSGNQGISYTGSVAATGGSGNYSYTVTSGTGLSAVGLTLGSNGSITGSPSGTETGASVSIKATDTSTGQSVTSSFTLTIYGGISFTAARCKAAIREACTQPESQPLAAAAQ